MRIGLLSATLGVVLLLGANAFAQDEPQQIEVAVDYSLVNFHAARGSGANNVNGGGGSFVYYLPIRWFGLKADLQGYGSSGTTFTIPAGNVVLPQGGTIVTQGNLFTYMFGPVIKRRGRLEPYGQLLVGGAHTNLYSNAFATNQSAALGPNLSPSSSAFAMTVGIGLDFHINRTISIRPVEIGYLNTHFGNDLTGAEHQNSFRYVAGVTFNFW